MNQFRRAAALALSGGLVLGGLTGCARHAGGGAQIIRIGHNQSTNHPTHTGLLAFEAYIERQLGTSTTSRSSPASCWAPRTRWSS